MKLIGERTRKPSSFVVSECLFADDVALVYFCRKNVVLAYSIIFDEVATENGLTLNVPKAKLSVPGIGLTNDLAPLEPNGSVVKVVKQFKYLGSLVETSGGVVGKVSCRIAQASS